MSVTSISNKNFESLVKAPGVKLVRFWASWCPPCMMMAPMYKNAAADIGDKALLGEVDVVSEPEIANMHNIRSIPTVVVYKDGEIIDRISGVMNEAELLQLIDAVG